MSEASENLSNINAHTETSSTTTSDTGTTETQQAAPSSWNGDEWRFKARNKDVVPQSRDHLIKWAQMGYDYGANMSDFQRQKLDFENQQKQMGDITRWREIDEYAKNNPNWREFIERSWSDRELHNTSLDPSDPISNELLTTKQELAQIKDYISGLKAKEVEARRASDDQSLDKEISGLRDAYKGEVDFDETDELGNSLEYRVLKYANDNGLKSFKTAFRDYFWDKREEKLKTKAKDEAAKSVQDSTKAGILGRSQAPSQKSVNGLKGNIKKLSYDDLLAQAKEELRGN